jgi:gentisate 1,2-dioxygenase
MLRIDADAHVLETEKTNSSASIPAVLFSTTDRPLQEAIGVYREQGR